MLQVEDDNVPYEKWTVLRAAFSLNQILKFIYIFFLTFLELFITSVEFSWWNNQFQAFPVDKCEHYTCEISFKYMLLYWIEDAFGESPHSFL